MSADHCQFLITDAGAPGFASRRTFRAGDDVEVKDQFTDTLLHLRADEVQPSRHTLCMNGKLFRVLRVLK